MRIQPLFAVGVAALGVSLSSTSCTAIGGIEELPNDTGAGGASPSAGGGAQAGNGGASETGGGGASSGNGGTMGGAGADIGGAAGSAGEPMCGNGMIEGQEQCDGTDFGNATCASVTGNSSATGNLQCTMACTIDASPCAYCGNGKVDNGEQCDGANLNGTTCFNVATYGGSLSCTSSCTFDTTHCTCGDGTAQPWETCDGSDTKRQTCATVDSAAPNGTLGCSPDCQSFDTSGCFFGAGGGGGAGGIGGMGGMGGISPGAGGSAMVCGGTNGEVGCCTMGNPPSVCDPNSGMLWMVACPTTCGWNPLAGKYECGFTGSGGKYSHDCP